MLADRLSGDFQAFQDEHAAATAELDGLAAELAVAEARQQEALALQEEVAQPNMEQSHRYICLVHACVEGVKFAGAGRGGLQGGGGCRGRLGTPA